ncbi:zf-HC2 domain-containing protein [Gordonia hirsuta]|nr:zf-HC2 domain-containing protein [Gordonia hirsuta]
MTHQGSPRPRRWAPIGAMFAPNPEYRAGRDFASTDHLAADAVVAYVDGVLRPDACARVEDHLRLCAACAADIDAQATAAALLRGSCDVSAPSDLVGELSQIPTREYHVRDLDRRSR